MKIYEKTKNIIKEYYKVIIVYTIIFLLLTIKLPYYIDSPGGLIDTSKKVITNENFKLSGSLNMAYVSELQATIPTYIYSKINKDWNAKKEEKITAGNEKIEDLEYRNKKLLKESYNIAQLVAYNHSNINYKIVNNKVYVTYIDDKAKTDLKVKDQIIKVDEKNIIDKNYLQTYIASKNINDKITFKVKRNKKLLKRQATLIDVNKEPKVGALITEDFNIKSNKKIKFNFKDSESGPSGGLMLTLTIYSYLNKIDITNGKKIAGTGTIDIDGTVGEISGVKYKLMGAVKDKADIFIVPKGKNYEEAKKVKKEKNYKIELIPVETFEEALKKLKE
ncbi:MAG: PDZ domain-containing protein [Bacilli bacterium]|nr:PDZ domain-containing protein [Bacilli bacterium]